MVAADRLRWVSNLSATQFASRSGDHGPGISAENRARIFGRFESARSGLTSTAAASVSGYGLSVNLSRQWRGTITIDNAQGGGAVFAVTVPRHAKAVPSMSDHGLDRIPSGIAGLDVILNGGFLKGGLYISFKGPHRQRQDYSRQSGLLQPHPQRQPGALTSPCSPNTTPV